jgi:hypothetical protein
MKYKVPKFITNMSKKDLRALKGALRGDAYGELVRFARLFKKEKTEQMVKFDPRGRSMYEFGMLKGELQIIELIEKLSDLVKMELKNRARNDKKN